MSTQPGLSAIRRAEDLPHSTLPQCCQTLPSLTRQCLTKTLMRLLLSLERLESNHSERNRGKKRQDGTANGRGLSPVRCDSPELDVFKVGLSLSLSCHNMTLQLRLTLAAFMVMDCAESCVQLVLEGSSGGPRPRLAWQRAGAFSS